MIISYVWLVTKTERAMTVETIADACGTDVNVRFNNLEIMRAILFHNWNCRRMLDNRLF